MKKLSILLLCMMAMIVTSCQQEKKNKEYNYENAISKNAIIVMSLNVNSMINKSGLYQNEDIKNQGLAIAKMVTGEDTYNILSELTKDLNNSGVDCSSPMYVALNSLSMNDMQNFVFTAKLGNKKKFENLLNALKEEGMIEGIKSGDGYKYLDFGDPITIAYNNKALVVAPREYISTIFSRSDDESIVSNAAFIKMKSENTDINYMLDIGKCTALAKIASGREGTQQINEIMKTAGIDNFNDVYAHFGINFIKGAIAFNCELYSNNKEFSAYQKEMMSIVKPLNGRFNECNSRYTNMMISYGFNGEKASSYIVKALSPFASEFGITESNFTEIKDVVTPIDGDITITYDQDENINIFADAKSNSFAEKFVATLQKMMGDNIARLNLNVEGDVITATSNAQNIYSLTNAKSSSVNDLNFITDLNDDKFLFGFITEDLVSQAVGLFSMYGIEGTEHLYMLDKIEFSADMNGKVEVFITFDNKQKNALESIVDMFLSKL